MAKMRDRNMFPPNGWLFTQPQTGWEAPKDSSFDVVVTAIIAHRNGNRFITKENNLSTDPAFVAEELDGYNAERCLRAGWNHFLADASPGGQWLPRRLSRSVGAVVESVKKTAAGIKVVSSWLGAGLRPVEQSLADKRSLTCLECPNNTDPNWIQKLDSIAAADIKKLAEIKNDMKLTTPYDDRLHSCAICDCSLTLKPWVPIAHIKSETSAEALSKLSAVKTNSGKPCWVAEEIEASK